MFNCVHHYVFLPGQVESLKIEKDALQKLIVGGEIDRYSLNPKSQQQLAYITPESRIGDFPNLLRFLERHKSRLIKRREAASGQIPWFSLNWPRRAKLFDLPKILIRQTSERIRACYDTNGWYCLKSGIIVQLDGDESAYNYMNSILNPALLNFLYNDLVGEEDRLFPEVKPVQLFKLPIRRIDFTTPAERRHELVAQARDRYAQSLTAGNADMRKFVADRIAAGETDVIHDLLAFLAQQMIDLNKQKQAEMKRFLTWLEGTIRITPSGGKSGWDVIAGKTDILDYLGDYQKGESEKSFQQIMDRLVQNRTKLGVNLSDANLVARLTAEYAQSLAVLRPIKAQLAATDTLIDQVVYQLYGLTEDEIKIVEGV